MTKLTIKVGDTEITVELDGCSADFDGKTLKIKADSVVNNYHHHYHQPQYPLNQLGWSNPIMPPSTFPPYTITCGQSATEMEKLGMRAWNAS